MMQGKQSIPISIAILALIVAGWGYYLWTERVTVTLEAVADSTNATAVTIYTHRARRLTVIEIECHQPIVDVMIRRGPAYQFQQVRAGTVVIGFENPPLRPGTALTIVLVGQVRPSVAKVRVSGRYSPSSPI